MVECNLPKVEVAGSSPVSRSMAACMGSCKMSQAKDEALAAFTRC